MQIPTQRAPPQSRRRATSPKRRRVPHRVATTRSKRAQPSRAMISANTLAQSAAHQRAFREAKPFRHVVIDDFLDESACEALLRDFPPFNERYARDEHGGVGRKVVVESAAGVSAF